MLEWSEERVSLGECPGTLGNPDAGIFVGVGGGLLGLALVALAVYGGVLLVKRYSHA